MPDGRAKSLLLTYHRVTEDDEATAFYDVPISLFRKQIAHIAARKGDVPVIVTFDDGTKNHLRAGEIMAEHGLKGGVFFLVVQRLGLPDHISRDDVGRLADLGHIIGSHTLSHRQLPTLSDDELATELGESRAALRNLSGQPVDWFAPPGGSHDARSLPAARAAGYRYFRTMDWGYAPPLDSEAINQVMLPTAPVLRNVSMRRLDAVLSGRATFASFALKQFFRRVLPTNAYHRLRDLTLKGVASSAR